MNIKVLRYVCLDINIPDFLFVNTGRDELKSGSNYHKAFCTVCKKLTENWRFGDGGSDYEQYIYINCHGYRHRVAVTEGDLQNHNQIFKDLYR